MHNIALVGTGQRVNALWSRYALKKSAQEISEIVARLEDYSYPYILISINEQYKQLAEMREVRVQYNDPTFVFCQFRGIYKKKRVSITVDFEDKVLVISTLLANKELLDTIAALIDADIKE